MGTRWDQTEREGRARAAPPVPPPARWHKLVTQHWQSEAGPLRGQSQPGLPATFQGEGEPERETGRGHWLDGSVGGDRACHQPGPTRWEKPAHRSAHLTPTCVLWRAGSPSTHARPKQVILGVV